LKIKNLLLIFITLLTFVNVSYASFPVSGHSNSIIFNTKASQIDDNEEGDDEIQWGVLISLLLVLGFGAYFLIKSWRRAWIDDIRWVRILTNVILGILLLILLLVGICSVVKGGCVYNMQ
tara:strand:+ start:439 stop:798 length:360 start_codon:yes stop_codon:yes gene_type:complete